MACLYGAAVAQPSHHELSNESHITGFIEGGGLFGRNNHSTTMQSPPEVFACNAPYSSGSAFSPGIWLHGGIPLSHSTMLGLQVRYAGLSGTFTQTERQLIAELTNTADAVLQHSLKTTIDAMQVVATAEVEVLPWLSLQASAGIMLPVSATYQAEERISEPENLTYQNGSRIRFTNTGTLTSLPSVIPTAGLNIIAPLALNKGNTVFLRPQLAYTQLFGSLAPAESWNVSQVQIGLGLQYHFHRSNIVAIDTAPQPVIVPPSLPEVAAIRPIPSINVSAYAVDEHGMAVAKPTTTITETITATTVPLLPVVFFDVQQSALPARMKLLDTGQAASFQLTDALHGGFQKSNDSVVVVTPAEVLDSYTHLLNVIGYRMHQSPDSKIMLKGITYTSANQAGVSKPLATNRMTTIKNYLTKVWKIDARRIATQHANGRLSMESDAVADMHRVEIESTDRDLLAPIVVYDTAFKSIQPTIKALVSWPKDDSTYAWTVALFTNSTRPFRVRGMASQTFETQIPLGTDIIRSPTFMIEAELTRISGIPADTSWKRVTMLHAIEVVKKANANSIDKHNYHVFGFEPGSAAVSPTMKTDLEALQKTITDSDSVRVVGTADRSGSREASLRISDERARAVAGILNARNISVSATGSDSMLYENTLPEGRYLSRSVFVEIRHKK